VRELLDVNALIHADEPDEIEWQAVLKASRVRA
jgi:hypothetical protein